MSRALDTTRRDTALNVGDELLRSGESVGAGVEVRDWRFVGDGSKAGKSPRGCWRVDTIVRFWYGGIEPRSEPESDDADLR